VHGFGFSYGLSENFQFAGTHLLVSLFAFNVGIEVGQLLVLALMLPLLAALSVTCCEGASAVIVLVRACRAYRLALDDRPRRRALAVTVAATGRARPRDRGTLAGSHRSCRGPDSACFSSASGRQHPPGAPSDSTQSRRAVPKRL
jgi:hypothetical protein